MNLSHGTGKNPLTFSSQDAPAVQSLGYNANISSVGAIKPTLLDLPTHVETSGTGYKRTLNYKQWRNEVTEALYLMGFDKEAQAFGTCSETPIFWQNPLEKVSDKVTTAWMCSGDLSHDAAMFCATCDNRCCPDCAARQSARFIARYLPTALKLGLSGGKHRIRHIVLTTPIALTSDTPEKVQSIYKKYSKLPRKALDLVAKWGKEAGRSWDTLGALQSAEFGSEGEKLHFHIVQYGDYLPQDKLSDAWSEVTGGQAYVARIYALKAEEEELTHAIVETLKYSTKFWKTNQQTGEVEYLPPNVIPHLMQVLHGTRRVKSWGVFYNLPEPDKEPLCCQECGEEMIRFGIEDLKIWQERSGSVIRSSLRYKLANKSGLGRNAENKSPPKNRSGGDTMTKKDAFSDEFIPLEKLNEFARTLKLEIAELQRLRRDYGSSHEKYDEWTNRRRSAMRRRNEILQEIKSRQMELPF